MARKPRRAIRVLVLLAASTPAIAQYVSSGSTSASGAESAAGAEGLQIIPNHGQSAQQQSTDRYQCHVWATGQTGFDPTQPATGMSPSEAAVRASDYRRAMTVCLRARGYTVRAVPAPSNAYPENGVTPGAGAPPSAPPPYLEQAYSPAAELSYHPLSGQIDGGFSVAAGATGNALDDGANLGLGLTWFPTAELPIGLRVDGSYSWFGARHGLFDNGPGFTSGREEIYGGDADLQLNLTQPSSLSRLYLLGGVGSYREWINMRQVSLESGMGCSGFFYCGPGVVPGVTAIERRTSPWEFSWNAGMGWEIATSPHSSFFVEARYLRINASGGWLQFVPIRFGVRF
jgi:hypothetical protein